MRADELIMKKHNTNIGAELLFLLRQQRYLCHQLKILTAKQQGLAAVETNLPLRGPRPCLSRLGRSSGRSQDGREPKGGAKSRKTGSGSIGRITYESDVTDNGQCY